jgi:hypothetical protein
MQQDVANYKIVRMTEEEILRFAQNDKEEILHSTSFRSE